MLEVENSGRTNGCHREGKATECQKPLILLEQKYIAWAMLKYKALWIIIHLRLYSTFCAGRMNLCTAAHTPGQFLRDRQWQEIYLLANVKHTARYEKKNNKGDNSD